MSRSSTIIGRNPVHEYLKSAADGQGLELFIAENAHGAIIEAIITEARRKGVGIRRGARQVFAEQGEVRHQGVVLMVSGPRSAAVLDDDGIIARAVDSRGVIVLLDQVTDPQNAGAIIRTAEALGAVGLVLPRDRSVSITPVVTKASAGATAYLPVATVSNVATFLERAKEAGCWIIGTTDHGTPDLAKLRELKPSVIVIGSEGSGMRRLTEEKCDVILAIPLRGRVSSLNASVAAGIVLFEALRER